MDKVGSTKWTAYVFESSSESDDETDTNGEENISGQGSEFLYGTYCISDPKDDNIKLWIPRYPAEKKPTVGMRFESLEAGEEFYREYASVVGFDVRSSSSHTFANSDIKSSKYFRCTKEGFKNEANSSGKRKTTSDRCGCDALMSLRYCGNGTYVVRRFVEEHTHDMIPNYAHHLLKRNRKMEMGHKKFMLSCAKANLGPMSSHKLLKEIVGGYMNMRVTAVDFKNYKRDLMANILEADAQMVISKLARKKEINSEFYFEYTVNDAQQLTRVFWSDPISRRNYAAFGQVVSFDSTYGTNRYCMVFAPFTGLDNHRKCVTFGCGLLMKEDVESYTWLFEHFKSTMAYEPTIMVTDQDAAMKVAFERVFKTTRHRLCMWHIMDKVSKKVSATKLNEPGYRKTLGQAVWNDGINAEQFEERWAEFLDKYDEHNNTWYRDMYNMRSFWIPAYFRDILLGGLVRTTSISESQNSFFGKYSNKNFSLVELFMHFDSAMERQRHVQLKNDVDSDSRSHSLKTPLPIEKHASDVYTLNLFSQLQEEISDACFYCSIISQTKGDDFIDYSIKEGLDEYEVRYMDSDGFASCSCNMFNRIGLPCSHVFAVLKANGCSKIPASMILGRWRKGAGRAIHLQELHEVYNQSARMEQDQSKLSAIWSAVHACIGLTDGDSQRLDELLSNLERIKTEFEKNDIEKGIRRTIRDDTESFAGIEIPETITIKPPEKAKNKGSGKGGRIKGGKEVSIAAKEKLANKGKRKCRKCGLSTGHDSRNCDKLKKK